MAGIRQADSAIGMLWAKKAKALPSAESGMQSDVAFPGENSQGDCDPDFDVAFESWTGTFSLLIELMLTAGVEL